MKTLPVAGFALVGDFLSQKVYSTGEADRVAHSGWWVENDCVSDILM